MPTGYTAGILDGTIKTFEDFAKQCIRAFLVHMRDEPFNAPVENRTPTDYHKKALERLERDLNNLKQRSDEWLIEDERFRLNDEIRRINEHISKQDEDREKLESLLSVAVGYRPPTSNHTEIRKFMIEQLKSTIDFDCKDNGYYEKEKKELQKQLAAINPQVIRSKRMKKLTDDILYHTEENQKEIDRCNETNEWIEQFINSLTTLNEKRRTH